jgi:hypothetical protein
MVLLVLDRSAAEEGFALAKKIGCPIWLGADAVAESDYRRYCADGIKPSRFDYSLSARDPEILEDALATIEEHHPRDVIWRNINYSLLIGGSESPTSLLFPLRKCFI